MIIMKTIENFGKPAFNFIFMNCEEASDTYFPWFFFIEDSWIKVGVVRIEYLVKNQNSTKQI